MASDILPGTTAGKDSAKPRHAASTSRTSRQVELSADGHSHSHHAVAKADSHHDVAAAAESDTSQENRSDNPPAEPSTHRAPRIGFAVFESIALILLLVDGLLCWLAPLWTWSGWGVGLAFLCLSRRWTVGDKLLGAVGVGLAPVTLTGWLLLAADNQSCTGYRAAQSVPDCSISGPLPPAIAGYLISALLALTLFAFVRLSRRAWQSRLTTERGRTG